jgi:hypothetical protein
MSIGANLKKIVDYLEMIRLCKPEIRRVAVGIDDNEQVEIHLDFYNGCQASRIFTFELVREMRHIEAWVKTAIDRAKKVKS